jgi:hypothetical protein
VFVEARVFIRRFSVYFGGLHTMFVVFLDKTLGNELDNDDGRCHFLKGVMWIYEFMRFFKFWNFFFFYLWENG